MWQNLETFAEKQNWKVILFWYKKNDPQNAQSLIAKVFHELCDNLLTC